MDFTSDNIMKKTGKSIHILITERNPHMREFLKREMEAEGYIVRSAVNGREMLNQVYQNQPLDLIILDPDMPDVDVSETLKLLKDRVPQVIIVLHTYFTDYEEWGKMLDGAIFVEKQGSSIVGLKQVISSHLKSEMPSRTT